MTFRTIYASFTVSSQAQLIHTKDGSTKGRPRPQRRKGNLAAPLTAHSRSAKHSERYAHPELERSRDAGRKRARAKAELVDTRTGRGAVDRARLAAEKAR
jgi:hypothetical protein